MVNQILPPRAVATAIIATASLHLALPSPAAEPLSATVETKDGRPIAFYLLGATEDEITYSLNETGAAPRKMKRSEIAELTISPPEGWADVQDQFDAGLYEEVADPLAQFAKDYVRLRAIEDSIGSLAKLYHLVALKALGEFDTLGRELQALSQNPPSLNAQLREELEFLVGWALYGRESYDQLERFLVSYEMEETPDELDWRPFKQIALARMAELSFLRARVLEHRGDLDGALTDYYSAMTVNLGSQDWLFRDSVVSALKIVDQMLESGDEENQTAQFEARALAQLADRAIKGGVLPASMRGYLEEPEAEEEPEGESEDESGEAEPMEEPAEGEPGPEMEEESEDVEG